MKRTVLAIAVILAGTTAASAQGYGPRGHGPHAPAYRHVAPPPVYHGPRHLHRDYGWHQPRRFWHPRPWHRRWY